MSLDQIIIFIHPYDEVVKELHVSGQTKDLRSLASCLISHLLPASLLMGLLLFISSVMVVASLRGMDFPSTLVYHLYHCHKMRWKEMVGQAGQLPCNLHTAHAQSAHHGWSTCTDMICAPVVTVFNGGNCGELHRITDTASAAATLPHSKLRDPVNPCLEMVSFPKRNPTACGAAMMVLHFHV